MNTSKLISSSLFSVLSITLPLFQFLGLILLSSLFVQLVVLDFDLFVAICAFASAAGSVKWLDRG